MIQNDKNSIVEKAVDQIKKLEGLKKELERRKNVLEAKSVMHLDEMNGTTVRFNVQEPLSGIDSMVEILQSLKSMGTKLKTVEANFSPHEFSANMKIETQVYIFHPTFFQNIFFFFLLRYMTTLYIPRSDVIRSSDL